MIIRYIVFILAFLCFTNLQGQSTKKPNVVLIIIDDLNDFPEGFYGHPQAKTPHMKALGFSGTRFKHAYSNNPDVRSLTSEYVYGCIPTQRISFLDEIVVR